jgi:GNAT superfamily N-acetyltransferase
MAFATWWRGDHLPALTLVEEFFAAPTEDAAILARLAHLEVAEVQRRMGEGHRPYVAWLDQQPVAYGWVATQIAYVGELDLTIALPQADRYLWDFATLPAWRGRGIYPRLLQAILMAEPSAVERFWIIAAPENRASSAGITKAGFTSVAHLSFQHHGQPGLVPMAEDGRVAAAATLLHVPLLNANPKLALSPCWHCAIEARQDGREVADLACWPAPSIEGLAFEELAVIACHCA